MTVPGIFYVNDKLQQLVFDELKHHSEAEGYGGFLPAVKQIANVAALPGIVKASVGQSFLYLSNLLIIILIT